LLKGAIMGEAHRVRHSPLTVQRDFAGSRLEEFILAHVYELAVPIHRRSTGRPPPSTAADERAQCRDTANKISQGVEVS
jgi:hypothetical protein